VPRVSAEIFVLPLEEARYIVYAPLRRAAFIANAKVVRFLGGLEVGVLDESADPDGSLVQFLKSLEILDAPPETLPITTFQGPPEPVLVTLLLTTACNLRCTYCYASAGETPVKSMTLEVARQGIDFVASNAQKRRIRYFEVAYHGGGEPTINWPLLTGALEYARQKATQIGLELRSSVATNGVMADRQIDWIIVNINGASVSFDGLPEVHDKHRLTKSGRASSHLVMHTMRRFDQAKYPYSLRLTATADQVSRLPESVEFICSNFRPNGIQIEPVYQLGRWHAGPSAETDEFVAAFRAAQQRAAQHGREISFSAARLGTLTSHFCGLSQDNFCLTPEGRATACYEVFWDGHPWSRLFVYGEPDRQNGGYRFDPAVLGNLRAQAVQNRAYCQGCFAKWTCAGDCYHKSVDLHGEGEFLGAGRCLVTRELTKDLILAKIAASGGLFWHELGASGACPSP
jgi:uncharacterized protein